MNQKTLAVTSAPLALTDLQTMAAAIASSKMFGVKTPDEALTLMLLCQAENLHPVMAFRRYHIIDGRPSMRADALQGEFEKTGAILWHSRTEQECAATFFADKKKATDAAVKRANNRYKRLKEGGPIDDLADIGELTIIRTIADAIDKKLAMSWDREAKREGGKTGAYVMKKNWKQSPRQMLHARCLTEGVRAISPGLIAGISTEDEIIDMRDDEQPPPNGAASTAEDRVRQATENAQPAEEAEVVEEKKAPATKITEVTEFNWRDVECHVGKAEGEMLGRKVGELAPGVISWFLKKFIPSLKEPVNEQTAMLVKAIEFAAKQPRMALWLRFVGKDAGDEWGREEFFEAMKANGVFDGMEPPVTKFDEIPDDKAQAFLARFGEAMKIVDDHRATQKAVQSKAKK